MCVGWVSFLYRGRFEEFAPSPLEGSNQSEGMLQTAQLLEPHLMSHLHPRLERTVGLPRSERRTQMGCKTVWPVGTAEAKAPGVAAFQGANSHTPRDHRLVQ
jgi:hypothetical protein